MSVSLSFSLLLLKKIEEIGEKLWSKQFQKENVVIKRPFHDDLGVGQVIFTFCDDLLETVYRFPWWTKWNKELDQIFDYLGLERSQIIRCLLAKLPSGVKIPVHHDTGLWATKSHRIHIPLRTSKQSVQKENAVDEVIFKAGYSNSTLKRVAFNELDVIELNNRAKHYVENSWSKDRIHLIFDYVDLESISTLNFKTLTLNSSSLIEQTRRKLFIRSSLSEFKFSSLLCQPLKVSEFDKKCIFLILKLRLKEDQNLNKFLKFTILYNIGEVTLTDYLQVFKTHFSEKHFLAVINFILPKIIRDYERFYTFKQAMNTELDDVAKLTYPKFLILGVMKCGTTSLYSYLCCHSEIKRALVKESHFFDWKYDFFKTYELSYSDKKYLKPYVDEKSDYFDMSLKYLTLFKPALKEKKITGEATPSYLLGGSKLAKRIFKTCSPNLKFLIILRNPVDRIYSQYQMILDKNKNTSTEQQILNRGPLPSSKDDENVVISFEELVFKEINEFEEIRERLGEESEEDFLDKEIFSKSLNFKNGAHNFIVRGLYYFQLKIWFKIYPKEQFKVIILENLKDNLDDEMKDIYQFLEVEDKNFKIKQNERKWKNKRDYEKMSESLREKLKNFYAPYNQKLEKLLGIKLDIWR